VRVNGQQILRGMPFTPSLDVAWVHEFDTRREMSAQFAALPGASFTVQGAAPSRNALAVKLGAQLEIAPGVTAYVRAGGELANRSSFYSGEAGVQARW
jgi:outer membrane autotransporter protein